MSLSSMKAFVLGAAHEEYSLKKNILIIGVIQNFHGMFKAWKQGWRLEKKNVPLCVTMIDCIDKIYRVTLLIRS